MKKSLKKKLATNKITIAHLSEKEQIEIRGGGTVWGRTCEGDTGLVCETGG